MNHSYTAIKLDLEKKYTEAIDEYEKALKEENPDLEIYINLAFIYWQAASQFAWADEYQIPEPVRTNGVKRYTEILNVVKKKFPDNCEGFFWEKYFLHRLIYEPFPEQEVYNIVVSHEECSLIPFFFLYLLNSNLYKKQKELLLEQCKLRLTTKNIYIITLLEGFISVLND